MIKLAVGYSRRYEMVVKKVAAKKPLLRAHQKHRGESLVCEVCGLSVMVAQVGDIVIRQDDILLCCGKPMK